MSHTAILAANGSCSAPTADETVHDGEMPESLIPEATRRSVDLLERAATRQGFVASPSFGHYSQIWARDTAISSLGALASGEDSLIEIAIASMQSLGGAISSFGQIPAVVRPDGDTPDCRKQER